ncbi:hypothetical protein ACLI4U_18910 (plasmid) [Natrialbaceae archaeon A-CW2]
MAAREPTQASPLAQTIDLAKFCNVPRGTTVRVDVRGDRSSFELVCERRNRWVLEGELDTAELTAVYQRGGEIVDKPATVPGWLSAVAREYGIDEVSL